MSRKLTSGIKVPETILSGLQRPAVALRRTFYFDVFQKILYFYFQTKNTIRFNDQKLRIFTKFLLRFCIFCNFCINLVNVRSFCFLAEIKIFRRVPVVNVLRAKKSKQNFSTLMKGGRGGWYRREVCRRECPPTR